MARQKGPRGGDRPGSKTTGTAGASAPAAGVIAAAEPAAPKKKTNPVVFMREVRAETRKITWPSRKETWITSVMVFIMVSLAVMFFALTDLVVGWGVSQFIRLGS
jgi:preprotein translocase subunit SecE